MNVTPMQWLFIAAPTAVIGTVLFLMLYESSDMERQVLKQEQTIRQMEFDRDFASAWNGEAMTVPGADIEQQKQILDALREKQREQRAKRDEAMKNLSDKMNNQLNQETVEVPEELGNLLEKMNGESDEN